ncbi:hypothetical protein N657DRAFT_675189 [Parathielavia appendiculata]|uniref:Uncharacterized protein n=1 Tax=Parathielavia appendiculata TaxID=2587402 RepID=A0AAN6TQW3_9PEZI|nr:hypothetical protein N657DRAFT_675189 [Parathielavia appendiculata]
MRTTTSWFAFVAGVLISGPQSVLGQKTPNENLVLADCGIGLGVNGGSTSREMIYYPGDVWTANGQTNKPTMMVNVPWNGAYPWGPQGAFATMPNGDKWSIWINDKIKDPNAAGDAYHSMESNKPLKCYSYHKDKVYQLADGKWCSSAYVCNHRGSPNVLTVKPGSGGGGGGSGGSGGGKDETRITASTNADSVELYETTANNIMATVRKTFKDGSTDCDQTPIGIGSKCTIKWKCHAADSRINALGKMAGAYDLMAATSQFSSRREVKWDVCKRPDTRPGKEGQCQQYETKIDHYVRIPRAIDATMDNIPPASSGRNPNVLGWMNYEITCETSALACAMCNAIGTSLGIASGTLGAGVTLGCAASGC